MSTISFIERLDNARLFGPGERARLRTLAGRGLDESVPGFDLFAGLWWPLRQKSPKAPRREVAWLVAKLYAKFPLPQVDQENARLPAVLGRREPRDEHGRPRYRRRFDALLCAPLSAIEPHLRWGLSVVQEEVNSGCLSGFDWVTLTDDLSIWDRGSEHRLKRDIRDIWAEVYLNNTNLSQ